MAWLFERVAVVGVGLIGGSLALAARRAGLISHVTGVGRSEANLATARARGIIDRATRDVEAIGPVDLIVLAVPVETTATVARALVPRLAPGTVVTDVGSVKGVIVEALEALLPATCPFVGTHPIAGSERSGAAAAEVDLFQDACCVITPTPRTDAAALERVEALWRGVGARVRRMAAADHDRALAWTSHLVHALAYTLAAAIDAEDPSRFALAGPSLREVTRVAGSLPELWRDVFLANRAAVDEAITTFSSRLERLRTAIAAGDRDAIARLLEAGRAGRRRLESER